MPQPLTVATPSDLEAVITRDFDAPRELVWDCHTRPDLVRRWLTGPPGWSMTRCDIDLRVGGKYRYELSGPGGVSMGFGGTFREVVHPERIASAELFDEDWTGGETLVTTRFEAQDPDHTRVVMTVLYASLAARDGALATGMADGMESSYLSLDAVLAEVAAGRRRDR